MKLEFSLSRKQASQYKAIQKQVQVKQDTGHIQLPDTVQSVNLVDEYRQKHQQLPPLIQQWLPSHDFHQFTLNLNLVTLRGSGARGVKALTIHSGFADNLEVQDVAPKTEWVPQSKSASVDFGLDSLGGLLKLVKLLPELTTKVRFKYQWNPNVATVLSGGAGRNAEWYFENAPHKYLDGQHELVVVFRRPRTVRKVRFSIRKASALYDMKFREDILYTKSDKPIKVGIRESPA